MSRPPPSPKTVRVRAAVAVNKAGGWAIAGWRTATDQQMRDEVREQLQDHLLKVRFVSVEIPVPLMNPWDEEMERLLKDPAAEGPSL